MQPPPELATIQSCSVAIAGLNDPPGWTELSSTPLPPDSRYQTWIAAELWLKNVNDTADPPEADPMEPYSPQLIQLTPEALEIVCGPGFGALVGREVVGGGAVVGADCVGGGAVVGAAVVAVERDGELLDFGGCFFAGLLVGEGDGVLVGVGLGVGEGVGLGVGRGEAVARSVDGPAVSFFDPSGARPTTVAMTAMMTTAAIAAAMRGHRL